MGSGKFASLGSTLSCAQISSFELEHIWGACVAYISSSHCAMLVQRVCNVWLGLFSVFKFQAFGPFTFAARVTLGPSSSDFKMSDQTSLLCLDRTCLVVGFRNFSSNTFAALASLVARTRDVASRICPNMCADRACATRTSSSDSTISDQTSLLRLDRHCFAVGF